jgi:hypothetical protein
VGILQAFGKGAAKGAAKEGVEASTRATVDSAIEAALKEQARSTPALSLFKPLDRSLAESGKYGNVPLPKGDVLKNVKIFDDPNKVAETYEDSIVLRHGSRHQHETKPSLRYINTGEGTQMEGPGWYAAEEGPGIEHTMDYYRVVGGEGYLYSATAKDGTEIPTPVRERLEIVYAKAPPDGTRHEQWQFMIDEVADLMGMYKRQLDKAPKKPTFKTDYDFYRDTLKYLIDNKDNLDFTKRGHVYEARLPKRVVEESFYNYDGVVGDFPQLRQALEGLNLYMGRNVGVRGAIGRAVDDFLVKKGVDPARAGTKETVAAWQELNDYLLSKGLKGHYYGGHGGERRNFVIWDEGLLDEMPYSQLEARADSPTAAGILRDPKARDEASVRNALKAIPKNDFKAFAKFAEDQARAMEDPEVADAAARASSRFDELTSEFDFEFELRVVEDVEAIEMMMRSNDGKLTPMEAGAFEKINKGAAGVTQSYIDGQTGKIKVLVMLADPSLETRGSMLGLENRVLTHELWHSVSSLLDDVGTMPAAKGTKLAKTAADMKANLGTVRRVFLSLSDEKLTPIQREMQPGGSLPVFENLDETMTYFKSHPELKAIANKVPSAKGREALGKFNKLSEEFFNTSTKDVQDILRKQFGKDFSPSKTTAWMLLVATAAAALGAEYDDVDKYLSTPLGS